jgi:class 3 adenylate cyclase/TolB-like protein
MEGRVAKMEGRVALVFTDVVGSSAAKRAIELGDVASTRDRAYLANIQSAYLKVVRSCTEAHGGREIMTIGDAFFLAFSEASNAIAAAIEIQNELRDNPIHMWNGRLHLRIGIHVGSPEYFENSWHGIDVDIAARAEAAASANQVLITEAAHDAFGESEKYIVRSLGTFALKGVGNIKLLDVDYDGSGLRRPQLLSNEQKRKRWAAATSISLLCLGAVACVAVWQSRLRNQETVLAAAAKSSILVTGFENMTGDPVFNSVLSDGLMSQLEQSPILQLISEQRLRRDAGYLGRPIPDHLSDADVRDLSIREGIKASISGSIRRLGKAYVVTVTARNIATGDLLVTEEAEAASKEHVMNALSKVATGVRRKLGESIDSIQKLDTPLGQATTPSLDAFEAYALGDAEHEKANDVPEAEGYYRQAVAIDPNFAMAWARLGAIHQGADGKKYLTKAFDLSKNISEREQLYIQGLYYSLALGDIPKTISTLELATHVYPKEFANYINLGDAYGNYGEMDKFLAEFQQASEVNPNSALARYNIMAVKLLLDRVPDAEKTLASIEHLGMTSRSTYFMRLLLLMRFLEGDPSATADAIKKTDGRPDQFNVLDSVARIQEFEGRYNEAAATWQRAQNQAEKAGAHDVQATSLLTSMTGKALIDHCDGINRKIEKALVVDDSKATLQQASYVAALCNQQHLVTSLNARLAAAYPSDTLVNLVTIPQSNAVIAISNHHPTEALKYLADSETFDTNSPSAYLRGLAYLQLHDASNAATAFQSAVQYKGAALICCQNYPLAELGLARAYRMGGDTERAKVTYRTFLVLWSRADTNLPQLAEARNELESVQ